MPKKKTDPGVKNFDRALFADIPGRLGRYEREIEQAMAEGRLRSKTDEVRITDSRTGGQKGKKLAQLGAVDPLALTQLALVAGHGSEKYSRMNYLRGFDWSLSVDALYRHFLAFQNGEKNDTESHLHHMAHAAWHALALVSFSERELGTDDRFDRGEA